MDFPALLLAFGKSLLFALAAVLPILNPPASAPVFVTLTRGVDGSTRTLLARRCTAHACPSRWPTSPAGWPPRC